MRRRWAGAVSLPAVSLAAILSGCSAGSTGEAPAAAGPARREQTGGGLPGFAGSEACRDCHSEAHEAWAGSGHARTVHPPTDTESRLLEGALLCGRQDARYVLGERHARRFLVPSESRPDQHVMLPCRYETGSGEWSSLHESDWQTIVWEKECGACHTTGFSSEGFTYRDLGVGCESCHGARARHGDFSTAERMVRFESLSAREEVTVCASCHLQGGTSRRSGLHFASNYEAGGDLFSDYQFDWASLDAPASDRGPIDVHQKLLIRDHVAGGGPARWPELRCTTCHAAHTFESSRHTAVARSDYCLTCHEAGSFRLKEYDQSCNVCEF